MGGMEGFGLGNGMNGMEQRLRRGEEGAERHIFGHSRETGEGMRKHVWILPSHPHQLYFSSVTIIFEESESNPLLLSAGNTRSTHLSRPC